AGEGGNVLQHSFAAIAKAGSLDGRDLQRAPQFVDHERSQGLAFDVFGHDQQRLAALGDLLQQRQQVFHRADFLFVDQNVGVLERNFHALGIGHEVGREVAAVELHAFNHVQLGLEGLGLLDGDDAILADLLHGLGHDVADGLVIVGGNGAHLGNHVAGDGLGELVQLAFDAVAFLVEIATNRGDRLLDTALHGHGVGAGRDRLHALAIDRLGQNGGGGGAVAGYIGGLAGDFTNHLCAHVFERVLEFDFFGYGDTALGDGRRTEFLFNDHVAALGAESDFDRVSQQVDAAQNRLPRLLAMYDLLCHNYNLL